MGRGSHAQWGAIVAAAVLLCCAQPGWASPDRLDNAVPDAAQDTPGSVAFSLGQEWLTLDGALNSENTSHSLFKLRYQFNPKVAGTLGYSHHNLTGDLGIISPIFNNQDSADAWNFDIGMNLSHTDRLAADAGKNTPFTPGSDFTIGVAGEFDHGSKGAVSESTSLLKAYLLYSTDLTEEMRAHAYFSSGRISGGGRSGSVNTVGAGLDYDLATGEHPLTLMADGILDVYNFRDPTFNTSRVSRFDVGLRYKMSRGLYANAGWMTVNDSENNAGGSGIFAGLNWVQENDDKCEVCAPGTQQPAGSPAPAAPKADAGSGQLSAAGSEPEITVAGTSPEPPMMDTPALRYPDERMEAGLRGTDGLLAANNSGQPSDRSAVPERAEPPLPLFAANDSDSHKPVELTQPAETSKPAQPATDERVAASAAPTSAAPAKSEAALRPAPARPAEPQQQTKPAPVKAEPARTEPAQDHGQVVDLHSAPRPAAPETAATAPKEQPAATTTPATAPPDGSPATDREVRQTELEKRLAAADREVQEAIQQAASAREEHGKPQPQVEARSEPAPAVKPPAEPAPVIEPQPQLHADSASADSGPQDKYTPSSRFAMPDEALLSRPAPQEVEPAATAEPEAKHESKAAAASPPVSAVPARPKPTDAPVVRPKAEGAKVDTDKPAAAQTQTEPAKPKVEPAKPAESKPKAAASTAPAKPAGPAPAASKPAKSADPGAALLPIDNAPASGLELTPGDASPEPPAIVARPETPASASAEQQWTAAVADDPNSTEIMLGSSGAPAPAPRTPPVSPGTPAERVQPGRPRHVQSSDVMQRAPVSPAARDGLAKLVSLLRSAPAKTDTPATAPAGSDRAAGDVPAGAKDNLQASATQLSLLVPADKPGQH
jgi:hypothetical protein